MEEVLLEVWSEMWKQELQKYMEVNFKQDGSQKYKQLSKAQEREKIENNNQS